MTTQISGDTGVSQVQAGAIQASDFAAGVAPIFTKFYESTEQSAAVGVLTLAHGLSTVPKMIRVFAVCKVAEAGFSVGDIESVPDYEYSGTGIYGVSICMDNTNLTVRVAAIATMNKLSATGFTITAANWKLIVRAWA